MQLLLKST